MELATCTKPHESDLKRPRDDEAVADERAVSGFIGDGADELAHALLHRVARAVRDLGGGLQRGLHEAHERRQRQEAVLLAQEGLVPRGGRGASGSRDEAETEALRGGGGRARARGGGGGGAMHGRTARDEGDRWRQWVVAKRRVIWSAAHQEKQQEGKKERPRRDQ